MKEMKEFNLEEAKVGQPVCTRDGKPVRIICWNAKNDRFPIVALVSLDDGSEETECYTIDRKYDIDDLVWDRDLMMTSIKHKE